MRRFDELDARANYYNKGMEACEICKQTFTTKGNLRRHKMSHSGEKRFECEVCKKRFRRSSHLAEHKTMHTGIRAFTCDVCQKKFKRSCHLLDHKKIHTRDEPPYQCDICFAKFRLANHLAGHKNKHSEKNSHECDTCHQLFTQAGDLKRHLRIHTGARPFKCDICGKTFARSSTLGRHQMIHDGRKPFQCKVCKECFSRSSHLTRHTKRKHANSTVDEDFAPLVDKSEMQRKSTDIYYDCDICTVRVAGFKGLIQHKLKEHGVTDQCDMCADGVQIKTEQLDILYICSLCGMSFDIPQTLENHMRSHGMSYIGD